MGNTTAVRSFALSGGAAGSLLAAAAIVLVVLGAILAFNAGDRSTSGTSEQSVAIEGAPEAAARSVAPATKAVAARPQPVEPVVSDPPTTFSGGAAGVLVLAPEDAPPLPPIDFEPGPPPGEVPDPDPRCVLGSVLPECVPPPGGPGGAISNLTGGLDTATKDVLGLDLGLQGLTRPLGESLDDLIASLEPPLKGARDGLERTLTGVGQGLDQTLKTLTGNGR